MKLGIAGSGNVAFHLAKRFSEMGIPVSGLWSRNETQGLEICNLLNIPLFSELQEFSGFDLVILAVTDNATASLRDQISAIAPVASTSGSVQLNNTSTAFPTGIFYPLQSFSKANDVNWKGLPVFVESENEALRAVLLELGEEISGNAHILNGEARKKLHVAAVFANNFSNFMFVNAYDYCQQNGLDFDWLRPLIEQTVAKLAQNTPAANQTGPARRNDSETIATHLEMLNAEQRNLYEVITKSILNYYSSEK